MRQGGCQNTRRVAFERFGNDSASGQGADRQRIAVNRIDPATFGTLGVSAEELPVAVLPSLEVDIEDLHWVYRTEGRLNTKGTKDTENRESPK